MPTTTPRVQAQAESVLPEWIHAATSVFDPWYREPVRKVYRALGGDDPESAAMAMFGTPLELGPATGTALQALQRLAERSPRLAAQLVRLSQRMPKPAGSMAASLDRPQYADKSLYSQNVPTQARMAYFYGAGEPLAAEWRGQTDELLQAFGGDKEAARTFLRLVGSMTPGHTPVPTSVKEAVAVWEQALRNPKMRTGELPFTLEQAKVPQPYTITNAPGKIPNANRALRGEPLSGDKAEAMAGFMVGEHRIPIDVHAIRGTAGEIFDASGKAAEKFDPEIPALRAVMTKREGLPYKGGITDTGIYTRTEGSISDTMRALAGRDHNEVWGQVWEGIRAAHGKSAQGGPTQILKHKQLLEYAAMLDPDRLKRALLADGSWTAPAISGVLAAAEQYRQQQAAKTPAKTSMRELYQ